MTFRRRARRLQLPLATSLHLLLLHLRRWHCVDCALSLAFLPITTKLCKLKQPFHNDRQFVKRVSCSRSSSPTGYCALPPAAEQNFLVRSHSLGSIYRIHMPGSNDEDNDDPSFVGAMSVPTFAALGGRNLDDCTSERSTARGLEGALQQGPAFVLDDVLDYAVCRDIIDTCENKLGFGSYNAGKNLHGAMQIVVGEETADSIARILARHVDLNQVEDRYWETEGSKETQQHDVRLTYAGLNRRWRIYRYAPGGTERFAPHIDAGFPPSGLSVDGKELVWDASENGSIVSRLTVLMYLNDDFVGGETRFYQPASTKGSSFSTTADPPPQVIASVTPKQGSCLVFPQGVGEEAVDYARKHWPLHEGSPVQSGCTGSPKYVIRSDILFALTKEALPSVDDHATTMFRFDHLVRNSFRPQSPMFDSKFLAHLHSLYNPHMGAEMLGGMLYSFIRFTKKRKIVEIGAGYSSLYILQALKDNDDDWRRIRDLQRSGKCRLMDWPWTAEEVVETYDVEPAVLLCVDNCEHQKETATGASAVAKALGLGKYFQFRKCDAFEIELDDKSVDVLWCDFGVGTRMKDFCAATWSSLRPGGFLLCHSTLTNLRTRQWLEAARAGAGAESTGIPAGEYVEVSLLEPHKQYQNSISIFQKRQGYDEPLFSEYA